MANDRIASHFYKYTNKFFETFLDRDDMVDLFTAKKIIEEQKLSLPFEHEINSLRMIQLTCNCAMFFYQMIYPGTWFTYFLTTISGLKKVYQCIVTNPIYGAIFFLTFYFAILSESDEKKFNFITGMFGLEEHYMIFSNVDDVVREVYFYLGIRDFESHPDPIKASICAYIKTAVSGVITFGSRFALNQLYEYFRRPRVALQEPQDPKALFLEARYDITYDDLNIREHLEKIKTNIIEADVKRELKDKKKRLKKRINRRLKKKMTRELATMIDERGNIVCLDKCERKVPTKTGCYCESDCSSTLFGRDWCYVDPDKCRHGKTLPKYFGRSWDYCDRKNMTPTKKCFTGVTYEDCRTGQ